MAGQMVEYALYVALRELRRFPDYAREQSQARWSPHPSRARGDLTIGVLGPGRAARRPAVARALADFGFAVTGWSRNAKSVDGVRCQHGAQGLDTVLAASQLLMLFLPRQAPPTGCFDRVRLGRDCRRARPWPTVARRTRR